MKINLTESIKIKKEIKRIEERYGILPSQTMEELKNAREELKKAGAKVQKIIDEVQGRAKERTIAVNDIAGAVINAEQKIGLTKKALNGCSIWFDLNGQDFPSAYKWTPMSTQFTVEMINGKWYLTDVQREKCTKATADVRLTEQAKELLMAKIKTLNF